jgi:hypothetical protein
MTYFLIYTEIIIEGPGIVSGARVQVRVFDGWAKYGLFHCSKMKGYILGYDHWNKGAFTYIGQRNKKLFIQEKIVGIVICICSIDLTIVSLIEISRIYHFGFLILVNCVFSLILFIVVVIDILGFITLILSILLNVGSEDIIKIMILMGSEVFLGDCETEEVSIYCKLKRVMGPRLWEWPLPIGAFHGLSDDELYYIMFPDGDEELTLMGESMEV